MAAKLSSVVVYNPTYGPKEGQEHLKLMYYYPENEKHNVKLNRVGLCEALVQFTKNFSPNQPCEYLHTQKHRHVFLEAETNFWMVLTVSNPVQTVNKDNNENVKVYQEFSLSNIVLKAILKQHYMNFRLHVGTILDIISGENGIETLKTKLQMYFSKTLHPDIIAGKDVMAVLNGLRYLPANKSILLHLQSITNHLKCEFKQVRYTHIYYEEMLIWTDLEKSDATAFSTFIEREVLSKSNTEEQDFSASDNSYGRFITSLTNPYLGKCSTTKMSLYVKNKDGKYERHIVVIYQVLLLTVCMLLNEFDGDEQLYSKIDVYFGQPILNFLTTLEHFVHENSSDYDPSFKFIHWNNSTLAVKTQCHTKWKDGSLKCIVPPETMRIILEIAEEFKRQNSDSEIITKAENDYWVVGKKRESNHLFIVICIKNANLISINEQVKRMCATKFPYFLHFD